ncbi:endospore germination permease [Bacillus sp. DNRA2]|uniref:GerAB/ArcD/ProY family transporter n=1 Tax=Bacillus sp. DNRA2 TaxID=2723053 RepID=UPI00145EDE93|nr:endospore germination permease [Bacillus sp. DNRA2]NMD69293.1 endospore germination permease [Bacillus sp. DNRA2]
MLTKWETFVLLFMTIPIMSHVVILPLLIDVVGRDAWISVLLSLPAALIFALVIYKLRLQFPTMNITEILVQLLGKWLGKGVQLIMMLYFMFLTILSFACLVDLIYIAFLPSTPRAFTLVWFWAFVVYAASKGIKRIALTACLLALISAVIGPFISFMATFLKHWAQLKPLVEYGWNPVLLGTLILVSVWMELLLLLCIPIENIHVKRLYIFWVVGISINAILMLSTATGAITIFGLRQADNFVYPALEIIRLINLGIIDRVDVYALIVMTFGSYIRCSLYLRLAFDVGVKNTASKLIKRSTFALLAVIALVGSYFIAKEHFRVDRGIIAYTYMIVLYPLPFLLLGISLFKRKKADTSEEYPVQQ